MTEQKSFTTISISPEVGPTVHIPIVKGVPSMFQIS